MLPQLLDHYLWFKAGHLVSVILWIGAQTALAPFVGLLGAWTSSPASAAEAERRQLAGQLQWAIERVMNPAMLAAFLFGALLAAVQIERVEGVPPWLAWKFGAILAISTIHGLLYRQYRQARLGRPSWPRQQQLLLQALGFTSLLAIVALAVGKPVL